MHPTGVILTLIKYRRFSPKTQTRASGFLIFFLSDLFHPLDIAYVADDRFIVHFHNDYIFQSDSEDLAGGIVIDKDILAAQVLMGAHALDALLVGREERAVLFPIPHVIPADIGGDNRELGGLLHDAVVDRDRLYGGPDFVQDSLFLGGAHRVHNLIDFMHDLREVGMQFAQDRAGLPDKHPAIPDVVSVREVAARRCQVRLLDEALPDKDLVPKALADLVRVPDIAVACFGGGRFDAQRHQVSLGGCFLSQAQGLSERFYLSDYVIG